MTQLATRFALFGVLWVSGASAQTQSPLKPPASAQRVAQRTALLGNELGTMWTFENPPLDYWKNQYNFVASPDWLADVRLSSVRFGESCSASFVSPAGLVMTNHHCARECIEAVSNSGTDYVVSGFYAATQKEERLCPGLFLDQLVEIVDVTATVQRAARGVNARRMAEAQAAEIAMLEEACHQRSNLTCEVVSLYHGGQHQMYKYRRYPAVKLVFAPELQAGFFGGDPDNFTFPRYDLDVSFLRVYETGGDTPVRTPHYFRWRAEGAREGELVFVTGNPGSTSRQIPISEVMYEKVYRQPFLIQLLEGQRQILQQLARLNPQAEQQVRQQLFEIENSLKSYQGQFAGLQDSLLLGRKLRWENEFRERVNANARLKSQYGDIWTRMADLQLQKMRVSPRLNLANAEFVGAPHVVLAAQLVGYLGALTKSDAERPEEFRGDAAARTEQMLRSPLPLDPQLAQSLLAMQIAMAQRWLEPTDPLVRDLVRPNETPEQAAVRLASASKILDASFRQSVILGKASGLAAVQDPFVQLARAMAPVRAELAETWLEIQAAERAQEERMAKALFAVYGTKLPPDATFTLRITDGLVKGYSSNGSVVPWFTTFDGMFSRSAQFANKDPFTLPKSFENARGMLNLATPFNFVSTTDITGGNSGSPVIDREGRVVGVAFDSNMEALPNEFVYRNEAGRTVSVHSAGITEALRNIYKAEALLRELTAQAAR
jgi:hypothetical protein